LKSAGADGSLIAVGDDEESHDSAVNAFIPADGFYEVRIREKRGRGGEDCFYRVEAEVAQPALTAFISRPDRRSQERQAVSVPQGNRVVTFLSVQRRGFSGEASLAASGLPNGVELLGAAIPEDRFWVPIVMQAAADAPVAGTLAHIEASAKDGERLVSGRFLQRVDLVAASADQLFHAAEVERLAVAVTEAVPYSGELETPRIPLAVNGTLTLKIQVQRTADFTGPLEVSFPFLPPWVDGPDKLVIPTAETTGDYVLRAWPEAQPAHMAPVCRNPARPRSSGRSPDGRPAGTGISTLTGTSGTAHSRRHVAGAGYHRRITDIGWLTAGRHGTGSGCLRRGSSGSSWSSPRTAHRRH
jgi:hypothetical protein